MPSLAVSAIVQTGSTVSAGTSSTGLRPNNRTFSLTGVMGTAIVKGDVVALWGSNDGGRTFQPLRQGENDVVQLNFYNPEVVIDDACDAYATQRVAVGSGSALAAVGFNGESVYINPAPAWVQGGNSGFAPVGILGTTDAVPFRIIAKGIDLFDSDGSTTSLGNLDATVPGNTLFLQSGSGGIGMNADGGGNVDISTTDAGGISISTGPGPINIGTVGAKAITIGNGTGATQVTINVGTGSLSLGTNTTVHDVNIGSPTGASSVAIVGGTGGVGVGSNAIAQPITIGNSTGTTSVDINVGTGACNVGANATVHTTTIGSTSGASVTSLRAGTGALNIVRNGNTWVWPNAFGAAGTKLTDAAGNGVLSWA